MSKYENLSTRSGFNSVVRHVKTTISLVESLAGKMNLADILSDKSLGADLSGEQLAAILRMTLVDKLGYKAVSRNLRSAAEDLGLIAAEVSKWNSVDVVLAYHHPDVGLVVANPKNAEQLALFGALRKREVAVAYVGRFEKAADESCAAAGEALLDLLEGAKVSVPASLYKGDFAFKVPKKKVEPAEKKAPKEKASAKGKAPRAAKKAAAEVPAAPVPAAAAPRAAAAPVAPPPASGPRPGSRMTPMYSVVVQNELFHNGNVEAWKRIIDSYKTKYPALEVYIYYDGERILNINSLFKWGKVKHGSTIQFAVAGTEIKDVAKLQRYLIQGASHLFEAFLHGPVSTVLKLF
jgi:hypothetical protein